MNKDLTRVKEILMKGKYAVFFGGAGVSTESGIPDFRGHGGLYTSAQEFNEYYLSKECLTNQPETFFAFFKKHMVFQNAKPNDAHLALAALEKRGKIRAVITQNIDGLHQKAGSRRVIELHGISNRYYCTGCGKVFDGNVISSAASVPRCNGCGEIVRPDVTLYGERLDGFQYADAKEEIAKADVLIVGGSSLVVNPAALLIDAFQGKHLIIINYSKTPYDAKAEWVIREPLSQVLSFFAQEEAELLEKR